MTISDKPRRLQFTLGNVLALTLGVALGFAPLRLWELSARPKPHICLKICILGAAPGELPEIDVAVAAIHRNRGKLDAEIRQWCRAGRAKIVAEPTILTTCGQPGSFQIGGQVSVPHVTSEGLETIVFKDYGTEITFHPTVARNGRIQLAVETASTQMIPVTGSNPKFVSRTLSSTQELASGESVVLGRLSDADTTSNSPQDLIVIASVEALPQR